MSEPMIKLDTSGKASVISYNVPEPTSYSGSHIVELDFDENLFTDAAFEVPASRKQNFTDSEIDNAVDNLINHNIVDSNIFPNIRERVVRRR